MIRLKAFSALIFLIFFVALSRPAGAVEVSAAGEARLGSDPQGSYERALGRALVRAIEKVVGISIESRFSQDARERIRGGNSQFEADLRDRLSKSADGFIAGYEVVGREETELMGQRLIRVSVRADVYESKVEAEVERLAALLEAADHPRVMVVIQEVIRSPDGEERIADNGKLAAYLEQALEREGFRIQGVSKAESLANAPVGEFRAFHQNIAGALSLARAEGADFLVTGRILLMDRGALGEAAPFAALANRVKVEVDANVRVLMTATGEVLSPAPVQHAELGSDFERAVHRVYRGSQGRGFNVVEKITSRFIPDIRARLEQIANDGRRWMVELSGVKNYRRQGRSFLRLLEGLPGVRRAKQRAYAQGRVEVEVDCTCSAAELQERVFQAARAQPGLEALDLSEAGAGRLAFRL